MRFSCQRPQRAEPLLDLTRFYRASGRAATALLFANAGKAIPYPKADILFIEYDAYGRGFE